MSHDRVRDPTISGPIPPALIRLCKKEKLANECLKRDFSKVSLECICAIMAFFVPELRVGDSYITPPNPGQTPSRPIRHTRARQRHANDAPSGG